MPPVLQGRRVTLRPPIEADLEARLRLGRDPEIHRMYGGSLPELKPMLREYARERYRRLAAHPCAWVIDSGRPLGEVRLDHVNRHDRRASLAMGIEDPAALGKGLGTEAIRLVVDHAFGAMDLHRLSLRVLAFNQRAIRAYQKRGFSVEGRKRQSALIDGVWHDDLIMGLPADDDRSGTVA